MRSTTRKINVCVYGSFGRCGVEAGRTGIGPLHLPRVRGGGCKAESIAFEFWLPTTNFKVSSKQLLRVVSG